MQLQTSIQVVKLKAQGTADDDLQKNRAGVPMGQAASLEDADT